MVGPVGTLPGVTSGSFSGSIFCSPFHGTPGWNSVSNTIKREVREVVILQSCCASEGLNNAFEGHQPKPTLHWVTWWPVDAGAIGNLITIRFGTWPAVRNSYGRAGGRLTVLDQIIAAVGVIEGGLSRRTNTQTSRDSTCSSEMGIVGLEYQQDVFCYYLLWFFFSFCITKIKSKLKCKHSKPSLMAPEALAGLQRRDIAGTI